MAACVSQGRMQVQEYLTRVIQITQIFIHFRELDGPELKP